MLSTCRVLGLCLFTSACAARYDQDLLDRRARSLYPENWVGENNDVESPKLELFDGPLELNDCLEYAMLQSAELRASFQGWLAQTERVEVVSTLPEPRLTYGEFLEEVQTRTGPQERRFGLSQAFPWPGTLRRRAAVANHQAEAAWSRVEEARLRVASETETAFLNYAFLGRELAITGQLLELLRGLEPVVQGRVRSGGGQEDLLRLQVEIGRLEDDLASLERRRPMLSAKLAQAMTLENGAAELPLPELQVPNTVRVEAARLFERAQESNPQLLALTGELNARREGSKLAALRRRPDFKVSVDYLQTGDALASNTSGSGDDPILLGLSMSLPIWGSSYAAVESEARHLSLAAGERLRMAEVALRAEIEEQTFQVDDAARRITLYRESLIPRANEALELTLSSYRNGGASVLDLIDSERALLEFQRSFWRACRDQARGAAQLRRLVGGEL